MRVRHCGGRLEADSPRRSCSDPLPQSSAAAARPRRASPRWRSSSRALCRRDRQRRFGAGLPRHGHRHRQARCSRRARAFRITSSTSSTRPRRIRRRASATMRSGDRRHSRRGRLPILAGGTMLYFQALRAGLSALPAADAGIRAALDARAARDRLARAARGARARRSGDRGAPRAHRCAAHPARARGASRSPASRCRRCTGAREAQPALEPASSIALAPADRAVLHAAHRACASTPCSPRDWSTRCAALRARYALRPEMPSMRAVGYRQAWRHLEGARDHARRCASAASPRRASSPSASSRGCARWALHRSQCSAGDVAEVGIGPCRRARSTLRTPPRAAPRLVYNRALRPPAHNDPSEGSSCVNGFLATLAVPLLFAAGALASAAQAQTAICYNCPPEWADWGTELKAIKEQDSASPCRRTTRTPASRSRSSSPRRRARSPTSRISA